MKISILGGGSWGTAVAIHLAKNHPNVCLFVRNEKQAKMMNKMRENERYLPGIALPKNLSVTHHLNDALKDCDLPIVAVPSHAFASIIDDILAITSISKLAWLTKGLSPKGQTFLHQILHEKVASPIPFAIISGPSFAKELAKGLPTAIVIASNNENYGLTLQDVFHTPPLRAYLSKDVIGVQIAATIKNVLAIATGISDGLDFGANAKAALITRGLQEMSLLGEAFGANTQTFSGLAGLGDLVLTATDNQSRNRRFGLYLGQGKSPDEAKAIIQQVVEGEHNCELVLDIAKPHQLSLPIIETVKAILDKKMSCYEAVDALINRPKKNKE